MLGHKIKAGGGQSDGEKVLDILASHPVDRDVHLDQAGAPLRLRHAAARARRSRRREVPRDPGGDIREVVRTILTSPEFFSAEAYRAKVKSPFEFVVSAVRATGTEVRDAMPLAQAVRQLGMPLYMCQPPTGYPDKAEAWVNTGALLNRMNFALQLVGGRMRGIETGTSPVGAVLAGDVSSTTASDDCEGDRDETDCRADARLPGIPEEIAMFSRRVFMKNGGLALLSLGFAPAFLARTIEAAGAARRKILITIFQRGAVDGLNMIVPFGERDYYASRPSIAVPKPGERRRRGRSRRLLRPAPAARVAQAAVGLEAARHRPRHRVP